MRPSRALERMIGSKILLLLSALLLGANGFSTSLHVGSPLHQTAKPSLSLHFECSESHRRFLPGTHCSKLRTKSTLFSSPNHNDPGRSPSPMQTLLDVIQANPAKSAKFSFLMALCGASLGPFLDSYHSLFGVLSYNSPLVFPILGSLDGQTTDLLTCVSTYWVPPLFGLAGFLIGWLYIWLDAVFLADQGGKKQLEVLHPSVPKVLLGISYFTFQYWLSGILSAHGLDRSSILNVMSILAAGGFIALDGTTSGLITSAATAVGGPLIEVGLISILPTLGENGGAWAYHYNDAGETGFFPLWIVPVYFLGGPANGNLARVFWNALGEGIGNDSATLGDDDALLPSIPKKVVPCSECQDTRAVPCPNCDDGTYVTYGQRVVCKACRGKGLVICRACFSQYDTPNDIESIREVVDKIPD
mmetsp:Transcript_34009/g.65303  ORF Transcript_34009/g.65303 Transcript_34009/m.65303 type:complete len:417 (+) Transcript_34009:95-1345(+)